jgi:hypothetical protein
LNILFQFETSYTASEATTAPKVNTELFVSENRVNLHLLGKQEPA